MGWRAVVCRGAAVLAAAGWLRTSPAMAAASPVSVNTPVVGSLAGQTNGTVADYAFIGSGNSVTVVLRYSGGNPVIDPGIGVIVYGPWGVVVNQTESGGNNGSVSATFPTDPAAVYDVQVYDYIPGFELTYHLLVSDPGPISGASAEPPLSAALPAGSSNGGPLLRDQSVRQQFWGQTSGTLHNYNFVGDGQPVSLVLNARPRDPILDSGIGCVVIDQWNNIVDNLPLRESATPSSALVWTFVPLPGAVYDVQVFNYAPGVLATYTVTAL